MVPNGITCSTPQHDRTKRWRHRGGCRLVGVTVHQSEIDMLSFVSTKELETESVFLSCYSAWRPRTRSNHVLTSCCCAGLQRFQSAGSWQGLNIVHVTSMLRLYKAAFWWDVTALDAFAQCRGGITSARALIQGAFNSGGLIGGSCFVAITVRSDRIGLGVLPRASFSNDRIMPPYPLNYRQVERPLTDTCFLGFSGRIIRRISLVMLSRFRIYLEPLLLYLRSF